MNARIVMIVVLGCAALARGAAPDDRQFGALSLDFKKPQVLPDGFFNPFRAQSPESAMQKQESASVTNDAVVAAVAHRGISGLVYAQAGGDNKVIIGDQVFGVGDELTFPSEEKDKDDLVPLVAGASIVLVEVKPQSLTLQITPEGDVPRQLTYPLRGFWRP